MQYIVAVVEGQSPCIFPFEENAWRVLTTRESKLLRACRYEFLCSDTLYEILSAMELLLGMEFIYGDSFDWELFESRTMANVDLTLQDTLIPYLVSTRVLPREPTLPEKFQIQKMDLV